MPLGIGVLKVLPIQIRISDIPFQHLKKADQEEGPFDWCSFSTMMTLHSLTWYERLCKITSPNAPLSTSSKQLVYVVVMSKKCNHTEKVTDKIMEDEKKAEPTIGQ